MLYPNKYPSDLILLRFNVQQIKWKCCFRNTAYDPVDCFSKAAVSNEQLEYAELDSVLPNELPNGENVDPWPTINWSLNWQNICAWKSQEDPGKKLGFSPIKPQ